MSKIVRVIRTYEVEVDAEYGDTEETLEAKGLKAVSDITEYVETAVLLPNPGEEHQYASLEELHEVENSEFDAEVSAAIEEANK